MLKYRKVTDEDLFIDQIANRPLVYLDQWMWCSLSENAALRERFITIGKKINATIMYSFVNLVELAHIHDKTQINSIIEVMDSIDYAFSDAIPAKVIEKEKKREIPRGSAFREGNPYCDEELIKNYVLHAMDPLKPFRLSSVLTKLIGEGPTKTLAVMTQKFADSLNPIVIQARQDPQALQRAKRRYTAKDLKRKYPPYTQDIYTIAIDFILVNETMQMPPNEWMDLMHTVTPVSYCDFVLLDRRWCHFIRSKLPHLHQNIAAVFSQQELDKFFIAMENFKEKENKIAA